MAAVALAALVESVLDRSGAEDEPRSTGSEEDAGNALAGPLRLAKLPLSRIKALMKADPDVSLASQESVFTIAKATVFWIDRTSSDKDCYRALKVLFFGLFHLFHFEIGLFRSCVIIKVGKC
ncbi:DNA polymerase epsilon subunit 4-like isoform X1 [Xyrauchen texanus]|uniref:DNA polymerase epsilon subunit 4-like isoform X1 n=1 Tax=Xyrauchen texanus TaxID=154827 RepID=UPI0022422217|nr:DNA polymerase epsilon subunit 4-like isoform X1 [Xyrauchen texanus]